MWVDGHNNDICTIYLTGGSSSYRREVCIGSFSETDLDLNIIELFLKNHNIDINEFKTFCKIASKVTKEAA